ncbi:hypothetical protein N7450_011602 [Penicillium hetheringtonii]|uniref:Hydrophobin n=1 Tax=Penicillium hetheringtonii TaxID=911720 RepID=A0AAD6DAI9_9EURO|nr:hypothetical protein N7450_011602 [Penicillium hetheringtonii]
MKFILASFAVVATVLAGSPNHDSGKVCKSGQSVVCANNGSGGLISLGNIATGALGFSCSGGDVYCCDEKDIQSGLANLDVNAQCSLNHVL